MLSRPEETCSHHLGFWLGSFLQEAFLHLVQLGPTAPSLYLRYPLHSRMLEVLEEGRLREEFHPNKLEEVTTKTIYKSRKSYVLLPPKVEENFPTVDYKQLVYPRLAYKILEPESKDILLSIVHGLVYNKDRLYSQRRAQDPYCPLPQCQGKVQDIEHIFCSCFLVEEAWAWL